MAAVAGIKALAILRLFGGVLFDSVSYAMGLTNISFKIYFWLTSLLPIPGMLLALYLIEKGMTDSFLFFALIVVWGIWPVSWRSGLFIKNPRMLMEEI